MSSSAPRASADDELGSSHGGDDGKDAEAGFGTDSYRAVNTALMDALDHLRDEHSAAGSIADMLPSIVVCGQQSSGKSSVMQAISGVSFPRSLGTCTRAPIEVRLRRTSQKGLAGQTACVKIRQEYVEKEVGGKLQAEQQKDVAAEMVKERCAVGDLEEHIREAQDRLLTLQQLDRSRGEKSSLRRFTSNVVIVEIYGAGVDLTLIDLPGVIKDGLNILNETLPTELVQKYAAQPNTIVAMVVSAADDIRNQVMGLVREVVPSLSRCVGILTKPDTVQTKNEAAEWVKLINNDSGSAFELQNGYYVLKNPDADQLEAAIGPAEAKKAEAEFFASPKFSELWTGVDKSKLGADNVVTALSDLLEGILHKNFSHISSAIASALAACEGQLAKLPQPFEGDAARVEFDVRGENIYDNLVNIVEARESEVHFWAEVAQKLFPEFGHVIMMTQPVFQLDTIAAEKKLVACHKDTTSDLQVLEPREVTGRKITTMQQLVTENLQPHQAGIPVGSDNYDAVRNTVKQAQKTWEEKGLGLLEVIADKLQDTAAGVIAKHLEGFPSAVVLAREALVEVHEELKAATRKAITNQAANERKYPVTFNQAALHRVQNATFDRLVALYTGTDMKDVPNARTALSAALATKKKPEASIPLPHDVSRQLEHIAKTMTYTNFAAVRFTDNVLININGNFVRKYAKHFQTKLRQRKEQALAGPEHIDFSVVMSASADVAKKQAALQKQQASLQHVQKSLQSWAFGKPRPAAARRR